MIDWERVRERQAEVVTPSNWEAPRIMPMGWREIRRLDDGAAYRNYDAKLVAILSCAYESDGKPWLHLSVSHRERVPSWSELKKCKELFLGDRYAYSVMPPAREYVNIDKRVLHLFAQLDIDAPSVFPDFTGGTGSI